MITINLYNFNKKTNSTKRPSGSGKAYSCAVKTGSSLLSPVVEISDTSLPAYNYAYIANFKRYYFIQNIVYDRGIWVLSLSVDVLASYRPAIGGTRMFILRSSARQQPALVDKMYPITGNCSNERVIFESGFSNGWSTGVVLVGVLNGLTTSGMTMYQFTPTEYAKLLSGLMGTNNDSSISEWDSLTQSIKVTTYEPLRYIGTVLWFPNTFNTGANVTELKLGNYTATGFTCAPVSTTNPPRTISYTLNIPKHPQATTKGKYCNLSPYSEYELSLGAFGTIKLDTTALMDAEQIYISIVPDPLTGIAKAYIRTDTEALLADAAAQWGVPLRISSFGQQSLGNILQTVGGVTAMAVGAAVASPVATVVGLSSSISGIADIAKGAFTTAGSNGSIVDHQLSKVLYARFWYITEDDNANQGRPYCYNNTPATLGGYMQAQEGLVSSDAATRTELESINAYMEAGFYYE